MTNMTSTEIYMSQVEAAMSSIRHYNNKDNANIDFAPSHLGGIIGQREILNNNSVMRRIKLST